MKANEKAKAKLINQILQVCVANNVPTTGELFFGLAFMTVAELRSMAVELGIKVGK